MDHFSLIEVNYLNFITLNFYFRLFKKLLNFRKMFINFVVCNLNVLHPIAVKLLPFIKTVERSSHNLKLKEVHFNFIIELKF